MKDKQQRHVVVGEKTMQFWRSVEETLSDGDCMFFTLALSAIFCPKMWSLDNTNNRIGWTHTEPITAPFTTADRNRVNVLLMMMADSFTFIEVKYYCHFCKWSNIVKLVIVKDNTMPNADIVFSLRISKHDRWSQCCLSISYLFGKWISWSLLEVGKTASSILMQKLVELHKLTF